MTNLNVFLVVSGECEGSRGDSSFKLTPGDWVSPGDFTSPDDITVRVSSKNATFLRIPMRDFRDRLPLEITQNMDRRIRGIAKLDSLAFRKGLRISQSIVPELKDPVGAPRSARLVPIREINKYADSTCVHTDCEKERRTLHELIKTAR